MIYNFVPDVPSVPTLLSVFLQKIKISKKNKESSLFHGFVPGCSG